MNRNLRLKINESLESRILSKALLLLCLACLHEKITFSESTLSVLERKRNVLANTAIANSIAKEEIKQRLPQIAPQDHPTLKVIEKVVDICNSGDYSYNENFIPEKMIHMKSEEERNADKLRIPPKKKRDIVQEELSELIRYIESEIMHMRLNNNMIGILKEMRSNEYPYSVILQAFKWYHQDIIRGIRREFYSEYGKFKYVLGIVKNKLPDTKQNIARQQRASEQMNYIVPIGCLSDNGATYQTKRIPTTKSLEEFW